MSTRTDTRIVPLEVSHDSLTLLPIANKCRHWLSRHALPLWAEQGYDSKQGCWRESLDANGKPTTENRRARVQGRQSYVFALASQMKIPGPWSGLSRAGLNGIYEHYVGDNGLLVSVLSDSCSVVDGSNKLYDQTFLLLALANARHFVPDASFKAEALRSVIMQTFRNPVGPGFVENCEKHPFQSNAHMHLFEAALAWAEASREDGTSGEQWTALADEVARFACQRFIDRVDGFLREYFDENWNPHPGMEGSVVEPGHQFEWAWLFAKWSEFTGNAHYHLVAKRLFAVGTKGINADTGAAVNTLNEMLEPVTYTSRLWPQTEWLKAALKLYELSSSRIERQGYLRQVEASHSAMLRYLATPTPGLWYDVLRGYNRFEFTVSPASSFYHIACAIDQLLTTSRKTVHDPNLQQVA